MGASETPKKLSETDKQLIIQTLAKKKETAHERVKDRYGDAIAAYRSGMKSDAAAYELFLKCSELVNFKGEKKKASSFRDWKRNEPHRKNPEFHRALRHQLHWLMLTLKVAEGSTSKESLIPDASERMAQLIKDGELVSSQVKLLQANVLHSVFARAYGLHSTKVKAWHPAPLPINKVYDVSILPVVRKVDTLDLLRKQWSDRILYEGKYFEFFGKKAEDTSLKGIAARSAAVDKYLSESKPKYLWAKEVDCYKLGDEQRAAKNMMEHLKSYQNHPVEERWIAQFISLLMKKAE